MLVCLPVSRCVELSWVRAVSTDRFVVVDEDLVAPRFVLMPLRGSVEPVASRGDTISNFAGMANVEFSALIH